MRRSSLLAIVVLESVILGGSLAVMAQSNPASPVPLIALIGVMSLGMSLTLRSMSRASGKAHVPNR